MVDHEKKQFTQYFDLRSSLEEIYSLVGIPRNISPPDLAKVLNLTIRSDEDLICGVFCYLDHPLIYEMVKQSQMQVGVLGNTPASNTFLAYVAGCYTICKQVNEEWTKDVIKNISRIPYKDKDSPKHFSARLAELEHVVLFKGHSLNISPLMPSTQEGIKTPESKLIISGKEIGVEVCSIASFSQITKMVTQRLSERLCKDLLPSVQHKRIILSIPEPCLDSILDHYKEIKKQIEANQVEINICGNPIKIKYEVLESMTAPKLENGESLAAIIPAIPNIGTTTVNVLLTKGLQVHVRIIRDDKIRVEKIKNALNKAARRKIKSKQVDLNHYDYGLLAIRIPYEFFVSSQGDIEKMKDEFEIYLSEIQNIIKHSSRYKAAVIFSVSHETDQNRRISMLRGRILELGDSIFKRKYLETTVGSQILH